TAAPAAAGAPRVLITKKEHALPAPEVRHDTTHRPPLHAAALIGTYVPGTNVNTFPKRTALRLRNATLLRLSMRYTAHGHEMSDRTSVDVKCADHAPDEEIFAAYFVNGNFTIPAGAKDVPVPSEVGFGRAVRVWGLMPHTHLRGTRWGYTLVMPDSSSRVVL